MLRRFVSWSILLALLPAWANGQQANTLSQQDVLLKDAPARTTDPPKSVPNAAKIVIYRGKAGDKKKSLLIFLNGDRVIEALHSESYVIAVTERNTVAITASRPYSVRMGFENNIPVPDGRWNSLPGCGALDLGSIFMGKLGPPGEMTVCKDSLAKTLGQDTLLVDACHLPIYAAVSPFLNGGWGHSAGYSPQDMLICKIIMNSALAVLNLTNVPTRAVFSAIPGRTYYVRWSSKSAGSLEVVDAATGAKEVQGLQSSWPNQIP